MMQTPVIYIVDDDDGYRKAVTRLVIAKGYKAVAFSSAEEFLAARVSGHGCVLLDIRMPGMSGLQLLEQRLLGIGGRLDLGVVGRRGAFG